MRGRSATGLALLALLAASAQAPAAPGDDDPKPKPKPQLELLTRSQKAALRQDRIKLGVESKRGERVRVEAELVVEGIPEDFHFNFKPQRKRLRNGEAKIKMELSQRQREVLAFGEQACMSATVNAQARVGKGVDTIHEKLRKSPDC